MLDSWSALRSRIETIFWGLQWITSYKNFVKKNSENRPNYPTWYNLKHLLQMRLFAIENLENIESKMGEDYKHRKKQDTDPGISW